MSTKGIILATFGSIYGEAVEKSVGIMEAKIKKSYPDAVIRRVFWLKHWLRSGMKNIIIRCNPWKQCWPNLRIPVCAMFLSYRLP